MAVSACCKRCVPLGVNVFSLKSSELEREKWHECQCIVTLMNSQNEMNNNRNRHTARWTTTNGKISLGSHCVPCCSLMIWYFIVFLNLFTDCYTCIFVRVVSKWSSISLKQETSLQQNIVQIVRNIYGTAEWHCHLENCTLSRPQIYLLFKTLFESKSEAILNTEYIYFYTLKHLIRRQTLPLPLYLCIFISQPWAHRVTQINRNNIEEKKHSNSSD